MKLRNLLLPMGLTAPMPFAEKVCSGVVCDSRQVRPGAVFVALKGRSHDGQAFVEDAIGRGAVLVLGEQSIKLRGECLALKVDDARRSFADLSAVFHGYPARVLKVCGVTGTNGKTTIAFMLRDILRQTGWNPGMIGTVHYEIGSRVIPALRTTPDAGEQQALMAQMVQTGCRSMVMEVSSHAIDQKRIWAVDFDVGIFSNLTRDHLDYHGDMEAYFEAKRGFFTRLGLKEKSASAVLNMDDAYGRRLADDPDVRARIVTYGISPVATVRATEITSHESGSRFRIVSPWGEHILKLGLMGHYNVSNALAAFTAGGVLGLEPTGMVAALESMRAVPGRLEEVNNAGGFRVFVDYAHTDDALENVLKTLRPLARGRLIVVFGCGGNRDRSKREAMGGVASRGADLAVVTTDNPRREDPEAIIDDVLRGFPPDRQPLVAVDRKKAIATAFETAMPGDVVLIAGKGHESFQEFAHTVIPFDDRDVAIELLGAQHPGKSRRAR